MVARKQKIGIKLVVVMMLCCVMTGMLFFYADMIQKELNEEIIEQLKEVAEQSVITLDEKIDEEFTLLNEIADRLSRENGFDAEETIEDLRRVVKRHSFRRMGIIMPDGKAYTTDGKELNLGDREYFWDSMEGKQSLSDKLTDRAGGSPIMVFSTPVYEAGEVSAVLFATYDVKELQNLLSISVFGGEGYSYVIKQNGDALIDTVSPIGFNDFQNVFDSLMDASETNAEVTEKLKNDLQNRSTGYITFHNKIDKYMYYSPLNIKDWYVLNVVPAGVMDSTRNFIMMLTYILCGVLIAIFAAFLFSIIKMERQKKKEMADILYVDKVTGGYTYARFCVEAGERMKNTDKQVAYIVMDIDNFKIINELFGYTEGDKTLCYIWGIWKKCCRENEIFARRVADRFSAQWFFDDREELNVRIEDFINEIQSKLQQKSEYNLKVTMGIYIVKSKDEDVQNIMNYAMMAHSAAKAGNDVWYTFYDDEFKEKLLQNKLLEDKLKLALKYDEFVIYYQPKYSVVTKELVGAEALVRWKKEDGSLIMPGNFIPLAEKNGFIKYLDKYVFAGVCRRQKKWLDEGLAIVPISVNLSRQHLYNDEFMEEYKDIVDGTGVPTEYVQLELTESAIFENQEALCSIIDKLHMLGFRILMDDFGTGYSSLMMLKSVPIDILKLDKSFVDDFDDSRGEKIITSVIRLAQALHIEVTAEGVETEEQYKFLKHLGCDMIQGFYFAKPMPEEDFGKLLKSTREVSDVG